MTLTCDVRQTNANVIMSNDFRLQETFGTTVFRHHTLALAVTANRMGDDGAARDVVVLDQSQAPLAMAARAGDQAARLSASIAAMIRG